MAPSSNIGQHPYLQMPSSALSLVLFFLSLDLVKDLVATFTRCVVRAPHLL
jgi:hypothetical protein